jgi:hypothetical protein
MGLEESSDSVARRSATADVRHASLKLRLSMGVPQL